MLLRIRSPHYFTDVCFDIERTVKGWRFTDSPFNGECNPSGYPHLFRNLWLAKYCAHTVSTIIWRGYGRMWIKRTCRLRFSKDISMFSGDSSRRQVIIRRDGEVEKHVFLRNEPEL